MSFEKTKIIVSFYDHTDGSLIYQTDGAAVSSLKYSFELSAISKIAVALPYADWLDPIVGVPDTIVEVLREQDGVYYKEKSYLLRSWDMFYDDELGVDSIVLGGLSLEHLLTRRAMRTSQGSDTDPMSSGGYITRAGEASEILAQYANYQIGSGASDTRRLFELSITYDGSGDPSGGRYQDEDVLYDVFDEIARAGNVDFEIIRQQKNQLLLKIGSVGSDKTSLSPNPVIISRERGNLRKPRYTVNREKEFNVVVAIGEGKVGNRTIFEQPNNLAISDGDWNRIEKPIVFKRERDETAQVFITKALAELRSGRAEKQFSFQIDPEQSGSVYRRDFVVGDEITVKWRGGVSEDLRIIGIESTIDVSEEMFVTVEQRES